MSYDVSVDVPTGPTHSVEAFWRNYTSNVAFMWRESLDLPDGLRSLDGAPCSEAAGVLAAAVERMTARAAEYRQKEPTNGWGNYDGALDFLAAIARAAAEHPRGVIRVSS